jgi:hypothetical protein
MASLPFIEPPEPKGKVRLECLEAWGGNRSVNHAVELPGLVGWVYSDPIGLAKRGGEFTTFPCVPVERFLVSRSLTCRAMVCPAASSPNYSGS